MHDIAAELLRRAERGDVEFTTSDAVIAEVAFIFTAKAHYHHPVSDAASMLAILLRMRGLRLRGKRVLLNALDIWRTWPNLGFVDALTASYAKLSDIPLATFDRDFNAIPDLVRRPE